MRWRRGIWRFIGCRLRGYWRQWTFGGFPLTMVQMRQPELDYITVKGFKSISSIEKLPLRPINVVIGPNGSGKSNFIGVFSFLHAIREGRLQNYVAQMGGADKILHFGRKVTKQIELHISFNGEVNQY